MKFNSLQDKVVVITGASSGIGKLAAEQFLKQGARVVLAARSEDEMLTHMMDLGVSENEALVVKTDVSQRDAVIDLARRAKAHFGRIDIWVNNAAVNIYATVDQLEEDELRRVIDVNLLGQIYGMQAALDVFKEQKYGNIINIASVLGKSSAPLQSIYTATKHGIVGFSSSLREELKTRGLDDIDVTTILPASINTPFFAHAKSKLGRRAKPIPPVYPPQMVVDAILGSALNPQPEVVVGGAGKMMVWGYSMMPNIVERFMRRYGVPAQTSSIPEDPNGNHNLFNPLPNTQQIEGEFETIGEAAQHYAKKHPLQIAGVVALPLLLLYATTRLKQSTRGITAM